MASLKVLTGEGSYLETVHILPLSLHIGNQEPEREANFPKVTTWEQSCYKILVLLFYNPDSFIDCLSPNGNDFVKCNCWNCITNTKIATKDYSWHLELLLLNKY